VVAAAVNRRSIDRWLAFPPHGVTESGGSLFLHLGPAGKRFPLRHFNRDVFSYEPMTEAPTAKIGVSFLIGPDGKASEVTVEDLNENGLGRLTRVGPK
jgi:hypothetical protein